MKSEGLLSSLNDRVRAIVLNACSEDLHYFLVKNGFRHGTPAQAAAAAAAAEAKAAEVCVDSTIS